MALARGLVGYAPAVIVPRLLMLAQITLLTRFIPQAEFGRLVLVMTVGDALDALCCNWIRTVLGRFGAGKTETLAEEATLSLIIYGVFAVCLALPAAVVASQYFQHANSTLFFVGVAGYLLTNGIARHALTLLALRGLKLAFFSVEAVRTGLGFTAVMALAISGAAVTYWPLVMAMNAATAIAAALGIVCALRGVGLRWPTHWGWDRRGYAMPLFAGAIIGIALNSSDRIVMDTFAGPAALATYAAALTLARQPLEFVFSVVNVRTFPEMMEAYETGGAKAGSARMADLISVVSILAFPAAIGLALVADPLARTFLTPAYVETARTVIPLGASVGVLVGMKMFVFDQPLHMAKTIWRNILLTAPAMMVSLVLTAWLASRFGAEGCVAGLAIQAALALAISVVQAHQAIKLTFHWDDLARIWLMCAIMAACVTISLLATAAAALPAALQLAAAVGVGALSYAAAGWLLMPRPLRDLLPRTSQSAEAVVS